MYAQRGFLPPNNNESNYYQSHSTTYNNAGGKECENLEKRNSQKKIEKQKIKRNQHGCYHGGKKNTFLRLSKVSFINKKYKYKINQPAEKN